MLDRLGTAETHLNMQDIVLDIYAARASVDLIGKHRMRVSGMNDPMTCATCYARLVSLDVNRIFVRDHLKESYR
jgi:hypothetical protein